MSDVVQVQIVDVVEDLSVYPRGGIGGPHVQRLVDAVQAGESLPPIVIDRTSHRIVDGWHRMRAYKRLRQATIPAMVKTYANEAELYADAVALNRGHGLALDPYDVRRAVLRLAEYGWSVKRISGVVRITEARVVELKKQAAINRDDEPVALKGGLFHLSGTRLSRQQERAVESYGGMQALFYARQLLLAVQSKLVRPTEALVTVMDELIAVWKDYKQTLAS